MRLDADFAFENGFRIVQFTPPGSPASVQFGSKITSAKPGSASGLYFIVTDIEAARSQLVANGAQVTAVFHPGAPGAQFRAGRCRQSRCRPVRGWHQLCSFATFSDPDGNSWLLQEVITRLPGRVDTASFTSVSDLAEALKRASAAHGEHEKYTAASTTRTGPSGTPPTWWPSEPASSRNS